MKFGMKKEEYNRRILSALREHERLLAKELSYSEDLQDKEAIARHRKNIEKVKSMLIEWGFENEFVFCWEHNAYEEAHKNVPIEHKPSYMRAMRFVGFNDTSPIVNSTPLINYVKIEHSPADEEDSYHRKIDSIKEINFKIIIDDQE